MSYTKVPADTWRRQDWTRPNTAIAHDLGVTSERVRQVRAKLGKPKPKTALEARVDRLRTLDTARLTLIELADLLCVSTHTVRGDLRHGDLPFLDGRSAHPPPRRARQATPVRSVFHRAPSFRRGSTMQAHPPLASDRELLDRAALHAVQQHGASTAPAVARALAVTCLDALGALERLAARGDLLAYRPAGRHATFHLPDVPVPEEALHAHRFVRP